jgi:hypothetical protein
MILPNVMAVISLFLKLRCLIPLAWFRPFLITYTEQTSQTNDLDVTLKLTRPLPSQYINFISPEDWLSSRIHYVVLLLTSDKMFRFYLKTSLLISIYVIFLKFLCQHFGNNL